MKKNITFGDRLFDSLNVLMMLILVIITAYPFLYVVMASFSDSNTFMAYNGLLWRPLNPNVRSYAAVFKNRLIYSGYMNTIFIVASGLAINMALTSFAAYGLSRRNLYFKKPIMFLIVVTMFFSGGLMPFYLTIKSYGLYNSIWAVILPSAINTFNVIICRTSFEAMPQSLEEAAEIDGAGHLTILTRIILPVNKAVMSVVALYVVVAYWNSWFNASIFLTTKTKFPLQLILREILVENQTNDMIVGVDIESVNSVSETIKYAVIIVSTLPVLCVYPFLQKYFVKGVLVGAVKE